MEHEDIALNYLPYLPLIGLLAFTLTLNLPFGFLRSRVQRYSFAWFLYIHVPIPFVYLLRRMFMVSAYIIPLLVVAAVAGQIWGGRVFGAKND
ncbi:MAG: hypothetical protein C4532_07355 [Candidatus Abyssobacteria bacterium SURF_17]|uniref:Uncharacterized protein n=1 Tax=Candidatus Abyssobacteria bacterium SURF_17 TaxID=2093361 RepID=A0A419F1A9_9BACT|nr:MAG: hypothetical protein C4532_07355 [Candidatus Abyssubacteria bacterium SURF_17]